MTSFGPFIIPDGETVPENQVLALKQEVLKELEHSGNSKLQRACLDCNYRETCKRDSRLEKQRRHPPGERRHGCNKCGESFTQEFSPHSTPENPYLG